MTTQYDSGRGSSNPVFLFLLTMLFGAIALVAFLHYASTGLPGRIATLVTGRAISAGPSAPVIVERIQKLNRLETVVYSLDTVVEGERSMPPIPAILTTDKILLIVHGQSVAGIDFAKLKPEDVHLDAADAHSIHVNLPPSEIFLTTLDNEHTRVYARSTGLLVPADQNLESDTRAKAQQQLRAAALQDGILDAARKNARATVTLLLYSFGFQRVEVT